MVCPMLSNSCLSVLSVTLVYCGQTVGLVKILFGMEVGLGPGHIVLDGKPAPQKRVTAPNFRPMFVVADDKSLIITIVAKRLDGSRCHLIGR